MKPRKRTKITNPFYERVMREGIHVIGDLENTSRTKITNPYYPKGRGIKTVYLAALSIGGDLLGEKRPYRGRIDDKALYTVVPRRIARQLRAKFLRGPWPPTVLLSVCVQGRQCLPVLALVSDAKARKAEPDAEVIVGQDYLNVVRDLEWLRGIQSKKALRAIKDVAWHHHVFSPRCKDEVHGRFDAMDDAGGIYVLDVGRWRPVAYARTRAEAVEIAEALAAEWRPALDPRNSVDRKILTGRRDYARGNYDGPFNSVAEMHAADGNPGALLEAVGRVVQEAKHHHAGKGQSLRGPGGLPCLLVDALAELERVSESFVAGIRRDATKNGRKR